MSLAPPWIGLVYPTCLPSVTQFQRLSRGLYHRSSIGRYLAVHHVFCALHDQFVIRGWPYGFHRCRFCKAETFLCMFIAPRQTLHLVRILQGERRNTRRKRACHSIKVSLWLVLESSCLLMVLEAKFMTQLDSHDIRFTLYETSVKNKTKPVLNWEHHCAKTRVQKTRKAQ